VQKGYPLERASAGEISKLAASKLNPANTKKRDFFMLSLSFSCFGDERNFGITYSHEILITGLQIGHLTDIASAFAIKFSDRIVPHRKAIPTFFIDMIITEIIASTFGQQDSVRLLQNLAYSQIRITQKHRNDFREVTLTIGLNINSNRGLGSNNPNANKNVV
jgi:hypothetical protein